MKSKIIDFIFKNGLLIFFIILIIGIILNLTRFNFLFGFDFFWYVNPFFLNRLFVWNNINTGFFYQIGDLMPLGLFYYFFHLFLIRCLCDLRKKTPTTAKVTSGEI